VSLEQLQVRATFFCSVGIMCKKVAAGESYVSLQCVQKGIMVIMRVPRICARGPWSLCGYVQG
jgi:hypothetical protein